LKINLHILFYRDLRETRDQLRGVQEYVSKVQLLEATSTGPQEAGRPPDWERKERVPIKPDLPPQSETEHLKSKYHSIKTYSILKLRINLFIF
jgi:hypothetical protein